MQHFSLFRPGKHNTRRRLLNRLKNNTLCIAALFLFALMPSAGWAQTTTRNVSNSRELSEALEADGTIEIYITRNFDLDSNHVAINRFNNNDVKIFSSAILVRGTKTIHGTVNNTRHTIFRGSYRNSTFLFAEDASLTINDLTFDGEGYSNHGPLFALDVWVDTKGNVRNTNARLTMNNCIITECTAKTAFVSDGYFDVSGGSSGQGTLYVNPMNPNSDNYIFPVSDTANWIFKWYTNFSTGGAAIHFDPRKLAANDNDNKLILNGCTFLNNEWSERDGYPQYTNGGAIYLGSEQSRGGTFTNCRFEGNRAGDASGGQGGAIYFFSTLPINTEFLFSGTTVITSNFGGTDGGGIFIEGGKVVIDGKTDISYNTAGNMGGGISLRGGWLYFKSTNNDDHVHIHHNKAGHNTNSGNGGGIFVEPYMANKYMELSNNPNVKLTISNNTCKGTNLNNGFGGGIYIGSYDTNLWYPQFHSFTLKSASTNPEAPKRILISDNEADCVGDVKSKGGGISVRQNVVATFTNCIIKGNKAKGYGGGISLDNSNATFKGCLIEENHAWSDINGKPAHGGGVSVERNGNNQFIGGTIRYNGYDTITKTHNGGGVSITTNGKVEFDGTKSTGQCNIYQNKAIDNGGGLYMDSDNGKLIGNCHVEKNTATNGGGIYYMDGRFENTNYVYSNTATSNGGGVYVDVSGTNGLQGLVIGTNNAEANNIGNKARNGGGVYTYSSNGSDHCITINNCKIVYNKVDADSTTIATGGGLCMANQNASCSHTVELTGGTIIDHNEAENGGGVYVTNGGTLTLKLINATLSNNKALAGHGGGIYNNNQTVTSAGATNIVVIKGNEATTGNGGGIYNDGTCTLNNCRIGQSGNGNGNSAINGGGLYNCNYRTTNLGGTTTFENNNATNDGGGLYNNWQVTQAEGSTLAFDNNTASNNGGGVYHSRYIEEGGSTDLTLNGATFTGNQAVANGGGIYTQHTCILNGCQIGQSGDGNGNSARNGGGIYKSKNNGMLTINGGKVSNNTASNNGGGIYLEQNVAEVNNNCHIEGNKATNDGGGIYLNGQHGFQPGNYGFSSCAILKNDGVTEGPPIELGALRVNVDYPNNNITLIEFGVVGGTVNIGADGKIPYLKISYYKTDEIEFGDNGDYFLLRLEKENSNAIVEVKCKVDGYSQYGLFGPYYYHDGTLNNPDYIESVPAISSIITLNGCTVGNGNEAVNGKGGGIYISDNATANLSGSNVQSNTAGTFGGGVYISSGAIMGVSDAVKVEGNTTKRTPGTGTGQYPYLKENKEDDVCLQTIKALAKGVITHSTGKITLTGAITGSWIGITEEEIASVADDVNNTVRDHGAYGNYIRQFTIDYGDNHVENDVTKFFFSNDKVFAVIKLDANYSGYATSTGKLEVTLGIPGLEYWYVAGIVDDNDIIWGNDEDNDGRHPDRPCRTLTGPQGVFARGYNPDDPNHLIFVVRSISIDEEAKVRTLANNTVVIRYPEDTQGDTYNQTWFANGTNVIPNATGSREIVLNRYPGGHKLSNGDNDTHDNASVTPTIPSPGPNKGPIVQMNAAKAAVLYNITLDGLKDCSGVTDPIHNPNVAATFSPTSAALAVDSVAIGRAKTGTISLSEGCKVQNNNNTKGSNNVNSGREQRPGGGVYVAGKLNCINNGFTFIQENNSKLDGGGVYVDKDGIADLVASAVLKNHSDQNGGGIYIANLGKAKFDGTFIGNPDDETEGNTADGKGGGVYKLGSLEVKGIYTNTFVVGNKAGSPLAQNNVHIPANSADTSMIVITGDLGCGSLIGVTKTKEWTGTPGYGTNGEHEYENDGNFNEVRTPIAKANWWNNSGADDWVRDADRHRVFFDDTEHYGVWRLRYNSTADLCYDESNQTIAEGDKIYSYDDYRLYFIETWRSYANQSGLALSGSDYLVTSPEGLAYLAKQVNSGTDYYLGKTIVQTKDFDLKAHYWEPIGLQYSTCPYNDGDPYIEEYHPFSGNYDGQGHLIQNAFSILPVHGMGLFGVTGARWYQRNDFHLATQPGSYIKNTFVINHNFVITCPNETYSGGIVGLCGTDLIDRCEAHGELNSYEWGDNGSGNGIRYVGGLAGYITDVDNQASEASITNSFSVNSFMTGANLGNNGFMFGGLCGMGFGKIENCYVKSAYPCSPPGRGWDIPVGALLYGNTNTANPVTLTNCYVIDSDTKYMVLDGTAVGMTYCYAPDTDQYIEYNGGTELGSNTNRYYSPTIGADQLGYMYADNFVKGGNYDKKPLFEALTMRAEVLNGNDATTAESAPGYRTYDRWARPALAYYEMFMDISYNDSIGIVRPINGDLPVLMMNNYGDGTNGSVGRGGFTALSTVCIPPVPDIEPFTPAPASIIGEGYVLQYSGPKRDYSAYDNHPANNDSEIDGMIKRSNDNKGPNILTDSPDCHFIYGDVSKAPSLGISANRISIYEHAAITEAGTLGSFRMTHVSITFDNSGTNSAVSTDGINYLGAQKLKRDWHLLSTPLLDASTGFNYYHESANTNVSDGWASGDNGLYANNPWQNGGTAEPGSHGGTEFKWLGNADNNGLKRYWMTGWTGSRSVTSGGYVSAEGFYSWTDGYFPSTFDANLHVFGQGTINETDENPGATDNTNARYPYGMDFYSWFEPQYHYINFKRNGPNHWHSDNPHVHLNYTPEKATNNSGDDYFDENVNEERLLTGKGYFASIAEKTLLQSSGQLGGEYTPFEKTISVTHTKDAKLCNGWNLVGNPFHAYLDFETFQGENNSIENYYIVYNADGFGDTDNNYGDGFSYYVAEGSENGAYASQYLHPHQGFFVNVKAPQDDKATPPALNFSEAHTVLRSAIGTSGSYRGEERYAYPLVNLFLKSDKGCSDVCVVELNRPEWGGATKLRDMYTGNGLFYAFHDNKNYAALFATPDAERIPLKFEPKDEAGDTYTLSWNTANGEFSKLILVDNLTGVQYDMLRNSSYSFSGKKGDYYSRFYITFDVTGIEEEEEEDDDTTGTASTSFAFFDGSEWVVTNSSHSTAQLDFIDLQGRVLHSATLAEGQARIGLPDVAKGMYLMRLSNNKGTQVQKVIVR